MKRYDEISVSDDNDDKMFIKAIPYLNEYFINSFEDKEMTIHNVVRTNNNNGEFYKVVLPLTKKVRSFDREKMKSVFNSPLKYNYFDFFFDHINGQVKCYIRVDKVKNINRIIKLRGFLSKTNDLV